MNKAVIFHGTEGSPEGNWFLWLKSELEKRSIEVWLPKLPHAEQPSLAEWSAYVASECPFEIEESTIIIGHSSGAILGLIVTQGAHTKVGVVVAVSVFDDNSLGWDANSQLLDTKLNYELIKQNSNHRICVHSDNDPYVPLDQAERVALFSNSELIIVNGQGHFNLENNPKYAQFPFLIDILHERAFV